MANFKIPYFQPNTTTIDIFLWLRDFFGRWSGDTLLKTRVIDLPGWDMESIQSIFFSYGDDIDPKRISSVKVVIVSDDNINFYDSNRNGGTPADRGLEEIRWDNDFVYLTNIINGFFDDPNFSNDSISRGQLTIWYTT